MINNRYHIIKRKTELVLSILLLVILSPLLVFILGIVYALFKQPPVIKQERMIDFEHASIVIYKIRTIRNSEAFLKLEKQSNSMFIKANYDRFIPLFCRWLRMTGLDETLQLINVIKGEMSLVGPRPFLESDLKIIKINQPGLYHRRTKLNSKPGITGCWQIWGDRQKGAENLIAWDEYYESNKSLQLDLKIIFATIRIMIFASHADSILINHRKRRIKNAASYENA